MAGDKTAESLSGHAHYDRHRVDHPTAARWANEGGRYSPEMVCIVLCSAMREAGQVRAGRPSAAKAISDSGSSADMGSFEEGLSLE
jgi:hypothetical protein